jgi:hypothetical protein
MSEIEHLPVVNFDVLDWANTWIQNPATKPPAGVNAQIAGATLIAVVVNTARQRHGALYVEPTNAGNAAELCAAGILNASIALAHLYGQGREHVQTLIALVGPVCSAEPTTTQYVGALLESMRQSLH